MSGKLLWHLQELDQKLVKISREIKQKELVCFLKEKQKVIEEMQNYLEKQKGEIDNFQKKTRYLEQELKGLEATKKETEEKLYGGTINNPKELEALRETLEGFAEKVSETEEIVLMQMDQIEDMVQEFNQKNGQTEEYKKEYRKGVRKYKLNKEQLSKSQEEIEQERKSLVETLDENLLKDYQRYQEKYKMTGIARIEGKICSGCRLEIPVLRVKSIKEDDKLHICENCGRLLINNS